MSSFIRSYINPGFDLVKNTVRNVGTGVVNTAFNLIPSNSPPTPENVDGSEGNVEPEVVVTLTDLKNRLIRIENNQNVNYQALNLRITDWITEVRQRDKIFQIFILTIASLSLVVSITCAILLILSPNSAEIVLPHVDLDETESTSEVFDIESGNEDIVIKKQLEPFSAVFISYSFSDDEKKITLEFVNKVAKEFGEFFGIPYPEFRSKGALLPSQDKFAFVHLDDSKIHNEIQRIGAANLRKFSNDEKRSLVIVRKQVFQSIHIWECEKDEDSLSSWEKIFSEKSVSIAEKYFVDLVFYVNERSTLAKTYLQQCEKTNIGAFRDAILEMTRKYVKYDYEDEVGQGIKNCLNQAKSYGSMENCYSKMDKE